MTDGARSTVARGRGRAVPPAIVCAGSWALALALVVGGCGVHPVAGPALPTGSVGAPGPVFPQDHWSHAPDPAALGFPPAVAASLRQRVSSLQTTGLMVVAGGEVVFEYGDTSRVSYIASVRKSVLAMLFGRYVENGTIRLDRTLADLGMTDTGGLLPSELEATTADLLAARSGVYHAASNSGDNSADAPRRGSQRHGAYFLYNNWDFNALGTIFERETGRNLYDALEGDLARPIGMEDFRRSAHTKTGDLSLSMHPAYHMHLSTRDMARVGYLMLRDGEWAGREIVPRAWVRRMVAPVTRRAEMNPPGYRSGPFGYGLCWWVFDGQDERGPFAGAYTGIGMWGQFITVLPALDLVVAHKVAIDNGPRVVSTADYLKLLVEIATARASVTGSWVRPAPAR